MLHRETISFLLATTSRVWWANVFTWFVHPSNKLDRFAMESCQEHTEDLMPCYNSNSQGSAHLHVHHGIRLYKNIFCLNETYFTKQLKYLTLIFYSNFISLILYSFPGYTCRTWTESIPVIHWSAFQVPRRGGEGRGEDDMKINSLQFKHGRYRLSIQKTLYNSNNNIGKSIVITNNIYK